MSAPALTEDSECDDFGTTYCVCHCMQPVMIHPKQEGATATKKPVLMLRDLQTHDQSQRVARHKAQELQLRDLPVIGHTGIAHRVPLAIGQWETAATSRRRSAVWRPTTPPSG